MNRIINLEMCLLDVRCVYLMCLRAEKLQLQINSFSLQTTRWFKKETSHHISVFSCVGFFIVIGGSHSASEFCFTFWDANLGWELFLKEPVTVRCFTPLTRSHSGPLPAHQLQCPSRFRLRSTCRSIPAARTGHMQHVASLCCGGGCSLGFLVT